MNSLLYILIFFTFISCSTAKSKTDNLIRPWTKELQEEEPYNYPYVAHYQKDGFKLRFIAANHVNDVRSATFKTIGGEINKGKVDLIIVEPFSYEEGESPSFFTDYSKNCSKVKFSNCMEAAYLVWLNLKTNKAPYIGGEPSDMQILEYIISLGYSEEDLGYFYLLRQIPQLKRQERLKKDYQKQLGKYLKIISKRLQLKSKLIFTDFLEWYFKNQKTKFSIQNVTTYEVAPFNLKNSMFTQKMSHHISLYRDKFIVNLIREKSEKYENILVLYGGSHHTKQRLALEYLFGKTVFQKNFF